MSRHSAVQRKRSHAQVGHGPTLDKLHAQASSAMARGDLEAAERCYRSALARGVEDADVYNNLASVCDRAGDRDGEVLELLARAYELDPDKSTIRANLSGALGRKAALLERQGDIAGSIRLLEIRVGVEPNVAANHRALGSCLSKIGSLEQAVVHFTRAANLDPSNPVHYNDLGLAFSELHLLAEAQGAFQEVLRLDPKSVAAYTHLGLLAHTTGMSWVAVNMLKRALDVDPNCGEAHNNLALFYREQGESDACRHHYREAIRLLPSNVSIYSGYLLSLNDDPIAESAWIAEQHRHYQDMVEGAMRPVVARDSDPTRRLRIGYLSPDFRVHSVAYFLAPLLESHDRNVVDVFCYSTGNVDDVMTARMKAAQVTWRNAYRMPDEELAHAIQADGVDILVELSGHTKDNRLVMLSRRVAPIQMSYLGYPNTTGLRAMDYRLTDDIADPPGDEDRLYSERLLRIPGGFLSYQSVFSSTNAPVVTTPAESGGPLTFGCFNNIAKINDHVLDAWAEILRRVSGSVLLLKARGLSDERVRARIMKAMADRGVDTDGRVTLLGAERAMLDHLKLYGRVDIALDTFPYNGTTTTCEALWMGCPVVTFTGSRHSGRVGASLLARLGLGDDLVATDQAGYVDLAVALAGDRPRLSGLRRSMRERMEGSSLMDAQRLAREIEAAYRTAWQQLCATKVGTPG
jgi:protein O-GlcNAc transferase